MSKKVLLLFISEYSGHHCASRAIEKALRIIDPAVETLNINSFNYTNPVLEKVINQAYMGVVMRTPEVWEYLYDNPKILKSTQKLRAMIHRFNTGKLKSLLGEFRPDAIICTQAFPCGMIADYKKSLNIKIPLIGVLTDYAPHSYWVFNDVDKYIVPSSDTGKKLIDNGIDPARIEDFGIPIDPGFRDCRTKEELCGEMGIDPAVPCVLIMGGTQGLGPIKNVAKLLDASGLNLQVIIATGTNKKVYKWLKGRHFKKKFIILPFAGNVNELMRVATVIITKPGGITTAEALAAGVPMLILNPLPGQEAMNTRFLLKEGVAVKAEGPDDVVVILNELLYNVSKLKIMSRKALALSKPDSAMNIARLTMVLAG